MEEVNDKITQIENLWKQIYEKCTATPSLYKPSLPDLTVDEVGGVVLTVLDWMKAIDDSKKNKNTYVLSKSVMLISLNETIGNLRQIASGNYNFFPQFVANLNQLLISLFPITFLNSRDKTYSNLTMDVAEELSKLEVLSDKIKKQTENYDVAVLAEKKSQSIKDSMEQLEETAKQASNDIVEHKNQIIEIKSEIDKELTGASDAVSKIKTFSEKLPSINEQNQTLNSTLNDLITGAKEIRKELKELLPEATSAGLASSFYDKAHQLKITKRWLMFGFISSVIALTYIGSTSFSSIPVSEEGFWRYFFHKLPILFPPIWLGWFFARSYGHANRLQEKYAYKEVMSKAFQGYRKQMEEVSDNSELAKNLSELTLTVLAENPSDVFERNCWDETPFHSLIGMILKRFKFGNKNNSK